MKCASCRTNIVAGNRCATCARRFLRILDIELAKLEEQRRFPESFDVDLINSEMQRLRALRLEVACEAGKENR